MSNTINRRAFLHQAACAAAGSTILPNLAFAADKPPATAPAPEWRNRKDTMGYARLGRTNFMTSRAVFGAGGLYRGGGSLTLLEMALDRGLNYIDTGRPYKQSEAALSDLLKTARDKVWICSKAGHIGWPEQSLKPGQHKEAAKLYTDQLHESLKQLRVDTIDCYMVQGVEHDWVVTSEALYGAFDKARKEGKVRFYGLSTHTNVPKVCELAVKTGWYDVIMLAVNPNSLADLSPVIKKMREAGIGLVSMKTSGPIGRDKKAYDEAYKQDFEGKELSPYQRAYAYLLSRGGIDAFISHTPNRQILEENLAVPTLKLSQASLDRLERMAITEARGSCRHCGQCTSACPKGVNVADMLRYHAYVHNYNEREVAKALYDQLGRDKASLCTACGKCTIACPESINLAGVISSLQVDFA